MIFLLYAGAFIGVALIVTILTVTRRNITREEQEEQKRIAELKELLSGKSDTEKYWCEEAKVRGFDDVEEFKKVRRQERQEEFLQKLMTEHSLTREEAEVVEVLPLAHDVLDKTAKRRDLTFREVKDKFDNRVKKPPRKFCHWAYYDQVESLADQFEAEGCISKDKLEHLNRCEDCNINFMLAIGLRRGNAKDDPLEDGGYEKMCEVNNEIRKILGLRPAWEIRAEQVGVTVEELGKREQDWMTLNFGGEDCFTLKERIIYATTVTLPIERQLHAKNCLGCKRMMEADRKDYLETGKIGGLAARALEEEWQAKTNLVLPAA